MLTRPGVVGRGGDPVDRDDVRGPRCSGAAADVIDAALLSVRGGRRPCSRAFVRPRAGDQHEAELADLYLVAVGQRRRLHALTVDVRAVQAADVATREG